MTPIINVKDIKKMVDMESLAPQPTMVEQAYQALLDAICAGGPEPGVRLMHVSDDNP